MNDTVSRVLEVAFYVAIIAFFIGWAMSHDEDD